MGIFSMGKPAKSEAPEFIEVGQIVNTHGVKGDVKVQPWDVTPAQLAGFKALYMDGTQFRPPTAAYRATWCSCTSPAGTI